MKRLISILAFIFSYLALSYTHAHSSAFNPVEDAMDDLNKVIYGEDNRVEVRSYPDRYIRHLARSVVAQVEKNQLVPHLWNNFFQIKGTPLSQKIKICPEERFAKELSFARCSGVLVKEDTIVSAGHCMRGLNDCQKYKWVFDVTSSRIAVHNSFYVHKSNVYSCKEVIRAISIQGGPDYSIIKLDRPVHGIAPLEYRQQGKIADDAGLVLIGYPNGVPSKIAGDAVVRNNENPIYFVANVDSYGGNSGAPVLDAQSGLLEGILVRGERDYLFDQKRQCLYSNRCDKSGCRGEDVIRMSAMKELIDSTPKTQSQF